jgi:hypothetical protein
VPLTIAHPAAAVPLARPLGRFGILSALIIGSLVPDLTRFFPLPIPRSSTHSIAGLFWFSLPAGAVLYVLFHRVLEQPLCALAPASLQRRLHPLLLRGRSTAGDRWLAVGVSLLVGAATHLVWDSFTHLKAPGAASVGHGLLGIGSRAFAYEVLQPGSSVIGVVLLGWWAARWVARAEEDPSTPAPLLTPRERALIVAGLVGAALLLTGLASPYLRPHAMSLHSVRRFIDRSGGSGVGTLGLLLLLYGIAWHRLVRDGRFPNRRWG